MAVPVTTAKFPIAAATLQSIYVIFIAMKIITGYSLILPHSHAAIPQLQQADTQVKAY